jgi:sigma-B regulation protein RsbU (phosphoserine phosphatase)
MANVHATMRAQTLAGDAVKDRVGRANRLMCQTTSHESFVTLFYAELDSARNTLTYCNAGHEHPLLFTARGDVRRLGTNGLALGVIEDVEFAEDTAKLAVGDLLVVFSDGVTDTPDDANDNFGIARLKEVVRDHMGDNAQGIARAIIDAATEHGGGKVQFDDLTALVMRRVGPQTMV